MIRRPSSLDEAEAMIAILMRRSIGGDTATDMVYRYKVRGVSVSQIAREDDVHRNTVIKRIERFNEILAEIEGIKGVAEAGRAA